MRQIFICILMVFALLDSAGQAQAVLPAGYDGVVKSVRVRLSATAPTPEMLSQGIDKSDDSKIEKSFAALLDQFLASGLPASPGNGFDKALLNNMADRFARLSDEEVNRFREYMDDGGINGLANQMFDTVTFYTVAADAVLNQDIDNPTSFWQRLPGAAVRQVPQGTTQDFWTKLDNLYKNFADVRRRDHADPLRQFYGDRQPVIDAKARLEAAETALKAAEAAGDQNEIVNAFLEQQKAEANLQTVRQAAAVIRRASASRPAKDWIDALTLQYEGIHGARGIAVPPGFFRDIATIKYLLTGLTDQSGRITLAGLRELEVLSESLPPATERPLLESLEEALTTLFARHGFRSERLTAMDFLTQKQFAAILRAGYMMDDIGAGLEHGRYAHHLQWAIVCLMHDRDPQAFQNSPLEIYRALGDFDLATLQGNSSQSFRFERIAEAFGLWGRVFDQSGGNELRPELSHPDTVRELIEAEVERGAVRLRRLGVALNREHNIRFVSGEALAHLWRNRNVADPLSNPELKALVGDPRFKRLAKLMAAQARFDAAGVMADRRLNDYLQQFKMLNDLQAKGWQVATMDGLEAPGTMLPVLAHVPPGAEALKQDASEQQVAIARMNRATRLAEAAVPPARAAVSDDDDGDSDRDVDDKAARVEARRDFEKEGRASSTSAGPSRERAGQSGVTDNSDKAQLQEPSASSEVDALGPGAFNDDEFSEASLDADGKEAENRSAIDSESDGDGLEVVHNDSSADEFDSLFAEADENLESAILQEQLPDSPREAPADAAPAIEEAAGLAEGVMIPF